MKEAKKAPEWWSLRLWQIQPIRALLLIAAVLGFLYLGYVLRVVTVPILLALALAYLFEPLVRRVTSGQRRSRPVVAIAIIVLAAIVVIVPAVFGIGFAVVQGASVASAVARNTTNLIASVQEEAGSPKQQRAYSLLPAEGWKAGSDKLRRLKTEVEAHRKAQVEYQKARENWPPESGAPPPPIPPELQLPEWKMDLYNGLEQGIQSLQANAAAIGTAIGQRAVGTGTEAFGVAFRTLGSIGMIVFEGFLTAFFFYFFCTGWGKVLAFWESLIPDRKRGRVFTLVDRMDRVIAGFIRGRLLICLIISIIITSAYFAIGVPVPLILGAAVGLLFLVPFTHWIGALLVMLSMWLEPSSVEWQKNWGWIVFAPIGGNLFCQGLDDYVL